MTDWDRQRLNLRTGKFTDRAGNELRLWPYLTDMWSRETYEEADLAYEVALLSADVDPPYFHEFLPPGEVFYVPQGAPDERHREPIT